MAGIDTSDGADTAEVAGADTVEQSGPMRLSELARREAVTAPTMSRVLTALDEQGLVRRTVDPDDARGVQITLSEKGAAALREVRSHRTALLARRLARLDDAQLAALGAALPALESLLFDDEPTC